MPNSLALALIAALALAGTAAAQGDPPDEDEADKPAEEESTSSRAWAEVKGTYKKAKRKAVEMGETVPDKIPDWVKEDLENVGDWEYRVVEAVRGELEATLNELGAER